MKIRCEFILLQSGLMTEEFESPQNIQKVRFLRVYCSSIPCSDGLKLKAKADVWINPRSTNKTIYDSKPLTCPDCNHSLYWRRVPYGCLDDPITN